MQKNQGEKQLRNILMQVLTEESRWERFKKAMAGPGGPRSPRRGEGGKGIPKMSATAGHGARVPQEKGHGTYTDAYGNLDLKSIWAKILQSPEVVLKGDKLNLEDIIRKGSTTEKRNLAWLAVEQTNNHMRGGDRAGADFWRGLKALIYLPEDKWCPDGTPEPCEDGPQKCPDGSDPPCEDGPLPPPGGAEGPIPIFKDMRDEEGNRLGAKAGGQGLQALLQNWINKNAPEGVDPKGLQAAVRQMVMDIAKQLKANDIPIQEAKQLVIDGLVNILAEAKPSRAQRKSRGATLRKSASMGKPMVQKLKAGAFQAQNAKGEKKEFHQLQYREFGAQAQKKAKEEAWCWANTGEPCKEEGGQVELLQMLKDRLEELDLATPQGREGALQSDQAYLGAYMFYKVMVKLLKTLEKTPDAPIEALIKKFKAELGGVVDISSKKYRAGSPYAPKRKGAIKESLLLEHADMILEDGASVILVKLLENVGDLTGGEDVIKWLQNAITTFMRSGLADGDRAVKASKAARGAKDPKEKGYEPDIKAAAGEFNVKQVIAPRLKQAGIDINTPQGEKLANNLMRLVRRFIDRHFERTGASVGQKLTSRYKDRDPRKDPGKWKGAPKKAGPRMGGTLEEKKVVMTIRILEAILSDKNIVAEVKRRSLNESRGYSFTNETDQDHSVVEKLASNLYPYLKKQLKFDRDASIRLVSDPENSKNPLGKTAYYDPASYAVTIYADNRHPKDILRSFSHEIVHHSQNCQGNFDNTTVGEQGYAQNDSHLREMERQAYEVGNLAFRDWEDGMKAAMMEAIRTRLAEKSQIIEEPKLKLALKEAINKNSLTKALFTG